MKITFCLPNMSKRPVGGFKIVFEYANFLVERGHNVNIVFWVNNSFDKVSSNLRVKDIIGKLLNPFRPKWFNLDSRVKKITSAYQDGRDIPPADIIFATSVETALPVSKLGDEFGKKCYLIQDFEDWHVSKETVYQSYQLGMTNIVIAKWLEELVRPYDENVKLVSNAINTEDFYVEVPIEKRDSFSLALLHHEKPHKGVKVAVEALEIVKQTYPQIKLNLFGTYDTPSYFDETWMSYIRSASRAQLRELFNKSSIFVCASVNEGFGLTGAESMASGCALASTNYKGVYEYAEDDVSALLSPVNDAQALANNIMTLIEDDSLRIRLAKAGSEKLKEFSWDKKVDAFEEILEKVIDKE